MVITGFAGLVGGALSMAAGEYVSVSSQRDAEQADRRKEAEELRRFPEAELRELTDIYEQRGLDRDLARQVAVAAPRARRARAHLRDELQLDPDQPADPVQAVGRRPPWRSRSARRSRCSPPLVTSGIDAPRAHSSSVALVGAGVRSARSVLGSAAGSGPGRRSGCWSVAGWRWRRRS